MIFVANKPSSNDTGEDLLWAVVVAVRVFSSYYKIFDNGPHLRCDTTLIRINGKINGFERRNIKYKTFNKN